MAIPIRRIYLSADIEGTCGIASFSEADKSGGDYGPFALQMSKEVAAACQGAVDGGATAILVKDAHSTARNIDANLLPHSARVYRGWGNDPYLMMSGLDETYDGAFFTGYHSGAGYDGNPLAHTMTPGVGHVTINGEKASELHINCLAAAHFGVPVLLVCGDRQLCEWVEDKLPGILTVPTNEGIGAGVIALHPQVAIDSIREAAEEAMHVNPEPFLFPLPERFEVELYHREHMRSARAGYYPGAEKVGPHTVCFESEDYFDVLRFLFFCL